MTDTLAQSLVDAAVAADWQAHHKAILDNIHRGPSEGTQLRISVARARAVAIAVLEKLADSYPSEPDTNATPEHAAELYQLADEIREQT